MLNVIVLVEHVHKVQQIVWLVKIQLFFKIINVQIVIQIVKHVKVLLLLVYLVNMFYLILNAMSKIYIFSTCPNASYQVE